MTVTDEMKRDECKREVGYRRRVYARLVAEGKMKRDDADRRIAIMEAMQADYQGRVDRAEPGLF